MEVKRRTARTLVTRLNSDLTADAATAEIRLISKHDPEIRAPLADAGAVPLLAALLLDGGRLPSAQEDASAALLNLSISTPESLMSTPGLLDALVHALRPSAPPALHQNSAATLYSLLSVDAYRPIIGSKRILLSSLITLLKSPDSPTRSVKDALKALFAAALYPLNRPLIVDLGAVPALFSLTLKDGRMGVVEDATAGIAQVAGCYESVGAFRKVGGVRALVGMVAEGSGRARENAAAALLNLAMSGGERAVGDIREVERVEEIVKRLALEGGSQRGRSKAEGLLRVLEGGRRRFSESEMQRSPTATMTTGSDFSSVDTTF